ncbi:hypothetical protein LCGC14_0744520 [marine sediment metagenome]|uniref:Uncharacterized protein n=1 Tax=marine sediment metagenome TaxID=412755 RepID=A0A0F9QQX1_9ZZZZ
MSEEKAGQRAGGAATAWYIIPSNNYLARWVNTIHLPYTVWHLSYVVFGAALAPALRWDVLGWALLAFFLGMGVAAHCFDLMMGDPLALRLPRRHLVLVGAISLFLAANVGAANLYWGNVPGWMSWLMLAGLLIVVGYNLEIRGMHGDAQFALFWGVFPFVVGYLAMGGGSPLILVLGAAYCFLTSWAQRVLSTRARYLRRKVRHAIVWLSERGGLTLEPPAGGVPWLLKPVDQALMLLSFAMPVLAATLLLWRTI